MKVKIIRCFLTGFLLLPGVIVAQQADIETLTRRLEEKHLQQSVSMQEVTRSMETIKPDGSWGDIDYTSVVRGFDSARHLKRLTAMTLAYKKIDSFLYQSEELLQKILLGMDYFYKIRPSSTNWWHIDIGAPQEYMVVLLLVKNDLDKETLLHYSSYLEDRTPNKAHKGKNRTWVSAITLYKGCIEDDPELVRTGFNSIASTIKIVDYNEVEGIKIDNSIHQHRPQLYSGGYGMSFMSDLADFMLLAEGTSFASLFTAEKKKIFTDVMLGGQQLFGYRQAFDFGTIGRNISRPGGASNLSPELLDRMILIDPANAASYTAWKNHLTGAPFPAPGNKYFWKSAIMTHHGENYYMSAKVISNRTNETEMINGENLLGYYLPLGATQFMTTGHEYKDIFPLWEWTRIPGTISVSAPGTAVLPGYHFGANEFGGGVSDGKNGVIAFENVYHGLSGGKAYFFMDDAMVCMGAGISAYRTNRVVTTVDQCFSRGDVYIGEAGNTALFNNEQQSFEDLSWVHHNNIGYIFPEKQQVVVRHKEQSGSCNLINESESKKEIKANVLTICADHTEQPENESYCYIVMPNRTRAEIEKLAVNPGIDILYNHADVQAIAKSDHSGYAVVFYKPGIIRLADDLFVSSDKAALLYIDASKKESYRISVADPLYKEERLNFTFTRQLTGEEVISDGRSSTVPFILPQDEYLGSTLTKTVQIKNK